MRCVGEICVVSVSDFVPKVFYFAQLSTPDFHVETLLKLILATLSIIVASSCFHEANFHLYLSFTLSRFGSNIRQEFVPSFAIWGAR